LPDTIDADAFRQTISRLVELFERSGVRGAIIGGLAAAAWSRERYTRDVDAASTAANEDLEHLLTTANDIGFSSRVPDPIPFAKGSRMVLLTDDETGLNVDISMAVLPYELEAIDRASTITLAGVDVPVAQPDDILVMKAVAGRPIDLADIVEILSSNPGLDLKRVRHYLPQFAEALDRPEIVTDFEALVRQAAR
jgi:hypothetical protein